MQALHDVVKAGHARYIGMSRWVCRTSRSRRIDRSRETSCYAWQFQMMQRESLLAFRNVIVVTLLLNLCTEYALHNHLTPFISVQNYHCALYRDVSLLLYRTRAFLTPAGHRRRGR